MNRGVDPRAKVLAVSTLSLAGLAADTPGLLLLSLVLAGVVLASRIPLSRVWESVRPFLVFLLLIFLVHLLRGHLGEAVVVVWRLGVVVGAGLLLSLTTRPVDAADGLASLLSPLLGRWGQHLGMTLALAIRFVGVLHQEGTRLMRAQGSRGVNLRDPRNLVALAVPLLVRAIQRADEAADALLLKGYTGERTRARPLSFEKKDFLVLIGGVLVAVVSVVIPVFV